MSSTTNQTNKLNPLVNGNDDDDQSMGEKTVSLDALLEKETDPQKRQEAEASARAALAHSVEDDMKYWARISSTVYGEDIKDGALDEVETEFKDYARSWLLLGKGLDMFSDISKLKERMDDKADRNIERKERKAKAAERKATEVALNAADSETRQRHAQEQRAAQAARDAARSKAQAELMATMLVPLDPATCPKADFNAILTLLDKIDEKHFGKDAPEIFETVPDLDKKDRDLVNQGYEHMLWAFAADPEFKKRYGYNQNDHAKPKHTLGQPVEAYFANVKDGSMYRRKVLSMQGLRNLIVYGPTVYFQLRQAKFAGNVQSYGADEGLNLMKTMTGTLVDLDTTVLRCSCQATLNTINASNKHKKLPTFHNSEEFANSAQAKEIVMACSIPLLQDFAQKMKLSKADIIARKIDWTTIPNPIPVATDNSNRGNFAVWYYNNAGQSSYHCNTPTMEDVNGAVLKAPFHCLRHYAFIQSVFGSDKAELEKKLNAFFEDGISDSCLNFKWKAIEAFGESLAHEGTIVDVIQRTQAENQKVFSMKFFEEDDDEQTNEIKEMTKMCSGKMGREIKTGKIREITGDDVRAWCKDASVKI